VNNANIPKLVKSVISDQHYGYIVKLYQGPISLMLLGALKPNFAL